MPHFGISLNGRQMRIRLSLICVLLQGETDINSAVGGLGSKWGIGFLVSDSAVKILRSERATFLVLAACAGNAESCEPGCVLCFLWGRIQVQCIHGCRQKCLDHSSHDSHDVFTIRLHRSIPTELSNLDS